MHHLELGWVLVWRILIIMLRPSHQLSASLSLMGLLLLIRGKLLLLWQHIIVCTSEWWIGNTANYLLLLELLTRLRGLLLNWHLLILTVLLTSRLGLIVWERDIVLMSWDWLELGGCCCLSLRLLLCGCVMVFTAARWWTLVRNHGHLIMVDCGCVIGTWGRWRSNAFLHLKL